MRKAQYITEPRTFSVAGHEATVNIRFQVWDNAGYRRFYTSQAEVAKAIKALAKAAGFNVLKATSESYSGGDSVDITVESELTQEQHEQNEKAQYDLFQPIIREPRGNLLKEIVEHFEGGRFNGSVDMYEYHSQETLSTVKDPDGNEMEFTTKYAFERFETKERFNLYK
jgi:hypothetical protein